MMTRTLFLLSFCFSFAFIHPSLANETEPDAATILVMDLSGSMWARMENRTRIEVARDVLGEFLQKRDTKRPLGVIAYGHRRKGDCTDIEVIAPTGQQDAGTLSQRLNALKPNGKTPISDALRLAITQIPATAEEADVVLITDGIETCVPDVCAVAEEIAASGIQIRAHVVGFGLSQEQANTLQCIPDKTGGQMLRPSNGDELADALTKTTGATEEPNLALQAVSLALDAGESGLPSSFEWTSENLADGTTLSHGIVSGDGVYEAKVVDLKPGKYRIIATTRNGRGEKEINVVAGEFKTHYVKLIGELPDVRMVNRGPYVAGQTVVVDLTFTREGLKLGGADFRLNLYKANNSGSPNGRSLTYSTVSGAQGKKDAGITLPAEPGDYILQLETTSGEVIDSLSMAVETDPEVDLVMDSPVAPGAALAFDSFGRQSRSDYVAVEKDGSQLSYIYLSGLSYGDAFNAPSENGSYDMVYYGYTSNGTKEKARLSFDVGTGAPQTRSTEATEEDEAIPGHVNVVFRLGDTFKGLNAEWSAIPLDPDLPQDAWAPMERGNRSEGWFIPGLYRVKGDAGDMQFEADVMIEEAGGQSFVIGLKPEPGSDPAAQSGKGSAAPLTEEGVEDLLNKLAPNRTPAN